MNTSSLLAAVAVALGTIPPAGAIEVLTNPPSPQVQSTMFATAVLPAPEASELPEPEVLAMMLVGLLLIGYRASRDSDEKFT